MNRLLCYGELLTQAGLSALRRRKLKKWAVAEGSNPQQWLGCFQPVDLLEDGVDFEYHDGAGWVRCAADRAVDLIQQQRRIIVPRMQAFLKRAYAEDTKLLRRA